MATEITLLQRNRKRDTRDRNDATSVVRYHRSFLAEPLLDNELVIDTEGQTPSQTAESVITSTLKHFPWLAQQSGAIGFDITIRSR